MCQMSGRDVQDTHTGRSLEDAFLVDGNDRYCAPDGMDSQSHEQLEHDGPYLQHDMTTP